jgi:dual specificity tyrosine-phosphorylation-regulated kinase 2/3/4
MTRANPLASASSSRPAAQKQDGPSQEKTGLDRTSSFRRRLSTVPGSRQASGQSTSSIGPSQSSTAQPNLSGRTRRQSSIAGTGSVTTTQTLPASSARPPRKSIGPGLITSLGSDRKGSQQLQAAPAPADGGLKHGLARTNSLNKARRTTMQPSTAAGAELPRLSTLTATTQSRANKVKSLQPPPKVADPDTPNSGKSTSKGNQNRAHTPSSSGNRRQSTVSGRASGLGARTISPTDARRLKRLSMMHPPMPTAIPKGPPTPQDDAPNPFAKPELPRLTQPSPSLIPRKMSTASSPTSARASPEGRAFNFPFSNGTTGGVALSAKSSHQSLISQSGNSGSRLPTPKPRQHSRTEQYGQDDDGELVPPVPAIPKAFESPKEHDQAPFFSSLKSMNSGLSGNTDSSMDDSGGFDYHGSMLPTRSMPAAATPRGSLDVPRGEVPRKRSGEHSRPKHKRTSTIGVPTSISTTLGSKSVGRTQPDPNGRKNNNLQPLRLPPLNLMPINTPTASKISRDLPRPSQEMESRDDYMFVQTPEPKRTTKTPSTPMTASKATFFRRRAADDYGPQQPKNFRSLSSHYALRDLQMDDAGNTTRFFDDSDVELSGTGVPIPSAKQRSAITPFASGSLPKGSGEFARMRGRPSGEYQDDYDLGLGGYAQVSEALGLQNSNKPQGPRPRTTGGNNKATGTSATPSSIDSPIGDQAPQLPEPKKEKEGGGLRRKLSLGWRRSTSKAANHSEKKSSPQQPQSQESFEKVDRSEKEKHAKLQKRSSEMPPPKLPASATWTGGLGEIPHLPATAAPRPSLETTAASRRRSILGGLNTAHGNVSTTTFGESEQQLQPSGSNTIGGSRNRSLHSEHPQAVPATRAASWGNFGSSNARGTSSRPEPISRPAAPSRHKLTASTISAIVKDKDDLAADEEMRRLSQKRKDVDSAARESEALKARAVARSPMSPEKVLHDSSRFGGAALNIFERGEIMDYEKDGIYFTGAKTAKKIIGALSPSPTHSDSKSKDAAPSGNYGYDDERGDYNIVLGDHLAYRYEVVDILGKGSFGQVVRCVDHKDGGVVAVKIIRNKKRFHQQALVEVGILGRLGEWVRCSGSSRDARLTGHTDNLFQDPEGAYATLSITGSFYFRSHLCIVTPCLSINLYEFIRAHNFTGFSLTIIRRFARQLLACLVLLQQKRIIHCDLKPENILLCEARKADVRVIDFGSSCREEEKVYTYIQSRFYRSPEVILGSSYGLGIDMWSLGCILAELWTGYPIFPGENEQEQLACIMEIFGPPDRHLVERCTRKKLFFDSVGKPRVTVSSKGRRRRPSSKTLQQALKTDDEAFLDFVARCLRWDPERRMKPHEAVAHPFITNMAFNQRPGIPDEARRPPGASARIRSSAASTNTGNNNTSTGATHTSPVRRKEGTSFSTTQAQASAATPASRPRALPETPQTVVRNGVPSSTNITNQAQGSPSKSTTNSHRRHSTVASAGGAAAVAGSKRASNGVVLGGNASGTTGAAKPSGSLAQMAARESMGAGAAGNGTGGGLAAQRWRA